MNAVTTHSTICQAAVEYARRGWHVFPAPPGKKKSFKSAEYSGGRNWGASVDPEEIESDWARWPQANVGIVCGEKSGLFVVECDTVEGHGVDGILNMRKLLEQHGELPNTIEAMSPSGSWHIYFRWPDAGGIINSASKIAPGIDVRADGGMVVGVPSVKPGKTMPYRWKNPPPMFDLADCPDWLLALCKTPEAPKSEAFKFDSGPQGNWAEAALRGEIGDLLAAPSGTRNDALNRAAFSLGQIVAGGALDKEMVKERLMGAALSVGLTQQESKATIASGLSKGFMTPRGPKEREQSRGAPHPTPDRTSRFLKASELANRPVPHRRWLVPELVPCKTVTLLSGDGGTGKSLLALQLAASVALERPWLNQEVAGGRALFLSAEDDMDELHIRLNDVVNGSGARLQDLDRLTLRSLAGEDALLAVLEGRASALSQTALYDEVSQIIAEEKPALVVLDTSADLFGGDENNRPQVRQFIGLLKRLALQHDCAVILLTHPSLTGISSGTGMSGSTAWHNSVRSRLYLTRDAQDGYEQDPDLRVLTNKKLNYGRIGTEVRMRWEEGVFRAEADQPASGLDRMAAGAKAERVFLKLLRQFTEQGRYVSSQPGPTFAPSIFAAHPDAEGCQKRVLKTAMEVLLVRGKVRIGEHGKGVKARSHIEEVSDEQR